MSLRQFKASCGLVHSFAPSTLVSLWRFSSVNRYWSLAPDDQGSNGERIAYFCLLKGLSAAETLAVLGAWHLHHNVYLDSAEIDALAEMVRSKLKYGKASKAIKAAQQERKAKNTAKVQVWRLQKRIESGRKERLTANDVYEALPKSRSGLGDDLGDWIDNQGVSGKLSDLVTFLDATRDAVRSHLKRLQKMHLVFKLGDVYFRQTESDGYPKRFHRVVKV